MTRSVGLEGPGQRYAYPIETRRDRGKPRVASRRVDGREAIGRLRRRVVGAIRHLEALIRSSNVAAAAARSVLESGRWQRPPRRNTEARGRISFSRLDRDSASSRPPNPSPPPAAFGRPVVRSFVSRRHFFPRFHVAAEPRSPERRARNAAYSKRRVPIFLVRWLGGGDWGRPRGILTGRPTIIFDFSATVSKMCASPAAELVGCRRGGVVANAVEARVRGARYRNRRTDK